MLTIQLRSKATHGDLLPEEADEIDYPLVVNRVLPDDIQLTGWQPAAPRFHARFSCTHREYKYFIAGALFDQPWPLPLMCPMPHLYRGNLLSP